MRDLGIVILFAALVIAWLFLAARMEPADAFLFIAGILFFPFVRAYNRLRAAK